MPSWSSSMAYFVGSQQHQASSTPRSTPLPPVPYGSNHLGSSPSIATTMTALEERDEPRTTPTEKISKWFKPSREAIKPATDAQAQPSLEKETLKHNFQQQTVLRSRCDHCGDKMWGTQLRCNSEHRLLLLEPPNVIYLTSSVCNIGCHNRCVGLITVLCVSDPRPRDDIINIVPLRKSINVDPPSCSLMLSSRVFNVWEGSDRTSARRLRKRTS